MKILLCLLLLIAVTVIEASRSKGRGHGHGFGKKTVKNVARKTQHQQCLAFCQTNSELKDQLVNKICPDPCEGIDCNGRGVCSNGRCTCQDGFHGCDCKTANPCFHITCQNGGTCEEGVCSCTQNFNGTFCETNLCDCVDCNGRGNCVAGMCECLPEFTGEFCQTVIDPCETITCSNGGTCTNGSCECSSRFTGDTCDTPVIDPCETITCSNGGTCTNGSCECSSRFRGDTCDTAVSVCTRQENTGAPPLSNFIFGSGDVARTFNDTTIDVCETSCTEAADCRGYEFVTDNVTGVNVCILYSIDVLAVPEIESSFILVSPNITTVGICLSPSNCRRVENVKTYLVARLRFDGGLINVDSCEEICTQLPGCISYQHQFIRNSDRCETFNVDVTSFLTSNPTLVSCPFVCTRNINMTTSLDVFYDYDLEDSFPTTTLNIDECELRCSAFTVCRSYQFRTDTNECLLYDSDVTASLTPDSNAITAICN